eukprot:SAG11_NODE_573_length_8438_cov_22.469601_7_plen_201_part_00
MEYLILLRTVIGPRRLAGDDSVLSSFSDSVVTYLVPRQANLHLGKGPLGAPKPNGVGGKYMPGDTDRGGAVPRWTRAASRSSRTPGADTRRAGNRSAQEPAPAPVSTDSGESADEGHQTSAGEAAGAAGRESSSEDDYVTAEQSTPVRDQGQEQGAGAEAPPEEEVDAEPEDRPGAQEEGKYLIEIRLGYARVRNRKLTR